MKEQKVKCELELTQDDLGSILATLGCLGQDRSESYGRDEVCRYIEEDPDPYLEILHKFGYVRERVDGWKLVSDKGIERDSNRLNELIDENCEGSGIFFRDYFNENTFYVDNILETFDLSDYY